MTPALVARTGYAPVNGRVVVAGIDPTPRLGDTVGRDALPAAFAAPRTDKSRVKVMLEPR